MKKIILSVIFLINLTSFLAQRFVVIEDNEASKSIFDDNDQYSLMGLLNNNIALLKDYLAENMSYLNQADYSDFGLKDGADLKEFESILNEFEKFEIRGALKIPCFSDPYDTIIVVKTDQSPQVFIDSAILANPDFESLLMIDKDKFFRWWDATSVGCIVRKRIEKQFCIKGIDLILIQINETDSFDSRIVHFCRSIKEGEQKHIMFSLKMWQLLSLMGDQEYGFNSLIKLNTTLSQELYDTFRKKQFDTYSACAEENFSFYNYFIDFQPIESKLWNQFAALSTPIFEKEYRCNQSLGNPLRLPRMSDPEDTILIVRTAQTLQVFLDSVIAADADYESLLAIDKDKFLSWWDQTELNHLVREDKLELTYWRDIEMPNAYALMYWSNGQNTVSNLLFADQTKNATKQSIVLNFDNLYDFGFNVTTISKDIPYKKFDQLPWLKVKNFQIIYIY
jgi:hypothetical protein